MWDKLQALFHDCGVPFSERKPILVVESASSFIRGKAALEVSHSLRGVIRAACWETGVQYIEVQPADLKKWATGKGNASKEEMVQRANNLGYEGKSDDEADAYLLLKWAEENAPKFIKH
jgi:Holliday junction resolvasome RuvABC endonuclease subunit